MPSKDSFHAKKPELNESIATDGRKKEKPASRQMSAQVLRLAQRTGQDPDEIAKKIPADTLRRTKYPVLEEVTEDGKRIFRHDIGVTSGVRSLIRK